LQVSVGVYIKEDGADGADGPGDRAALTEAIAAWRAAGVDEILFWMDPPTLPRLEVLATAMA
jgi:hypothetical protein